MVEELKEARDAGLIASGPSPWCAPCFVVPKPRSEALRIVLDYRFMNAQTVRDAYPLPNLQDGLAQLGPCRVFNKLDLKSGFWQVPVHPDS